MNLFSSMTYSSSPVESCFRQIIQVKHFRWKTLFLARLTKSFGDIPCVQPAHFVPNRLENKYKIQVNKRK